MTRRLVAVRHIDFEDLDGLEALFVARGFDVTYREAQVASLADAEAADLVVVLGGPFSAYDDRCHFLAEECRLIERRLAASRPLLGICLGAQLIARALGARNCRGDTPEIGWLPLRLDTGGGQNPLAALDGAAVLHWHGDTFDLPRGARRLASTDGYPNQAFSFRPAVLALQFHLEVAAPGFDRWLHGHAAELNRERIDPGALRSAARTHAPALSIAAGSVIGDWLDQCPALGEPSPM